MASSKKYNFGRILVTLLWLLVGSGVVVLLVAAISKRKSERCTGVNVIITGVQHNFFIDENDVVAILKKTNKGEFEKNTVSSIDLAAMEIALQKDQWVRKAELFFDNNDVLQVRVSEREPIARVFTLSGKSFYLDSALAMLPLSDKFSARLPVFTSFPTELKVLKQQDSVLLKEIKTLSEYISQHPFWMAQIEQIDIEQDRTFILIPKVGDQVIYFGNTNDCLQKFNKLLTFYKQVEQYAGWNKYSAIGLQYKNQLIGVRRGEAEIKMDSLKTVQIMKNIIENAQNKTDDSTNIQLIQPAEDNNVVNKHHDTDDDMPGEEVGQEEAPVHEKVELPAIGSTLVPVKQIKEEKSQSNMKPDKISGQNKIQVPVVKPAVVTDKVLKEEKSHPITDSDRNGVKENSKRNEQEPDKKVKEVPKAVMPSKNDY